MPEINDILLLHNRYAWPGGEDTVVSAESELLRNHGKLVTEITAENSEMADAAKASKALALWRGAWSKKSYLNIRQALSEKHYDIAHIHNFWFRFSPSIIAACHEAGVPVVVTLHNFRLLCPGAVMLNTSGEACSDCLEKGLWTGIRRKCYHNSTFATAAVARMIYANRKSGLWNRCVDAYIVPSEFCRKMYIRGGLPPKKIFVKPNFTDDPFPEKEIIPIPESKRMIFIGRLSREKGLHTLVEAWKIVARSIKNAELNIVGEGPMLDELKSRAKDENIVFSGRLSKCELLNRITSSHALVLPSECYETFGLVVVEAFACGRCAITSDIGAPCNLIKPNKTGLIFRAGDSEDLAKQITTVLSDDRLAKRMGDAARHEYAQNYTAEKNYEKLMECYRKAMEKR